MLIELYFLKLKKVILISNSKYQFHYSEKGDWWTGETSDGRSGDFPSVFVAPVDSRQKLPDIICVAFQEIVDLTPENIAKAPTKNLDVWGELIQEALDKSDEKVSFDIFRKIMSFGKSTFFGEFFYLICIHKNQTQVKKILFSMFTYEVSN